MEHEDIYALRQILQRESVRYNEPIDSYVGSDVDVKKVWGKDIDASDINRKLNDLDHFPHLFVLACLMDRQTKAERAWAIPYIICKRLCNNHFDFQSLSQLGQREIIDFFIHNKLHRFGKVAGETFFAAIQKINTDYYGDASKIWKVSSFGNSKPSSSEVILNFLQFQGCGIKIATMATNILHRHLGVEYSDYYSLDISPDIHIRRVLFRLGLLEDWNDNESIIYRARMLNPEYPGIIDNACWNIGRKYCSPQKNTNQPKCNVCPLNKYCHFYDNIAMLNDILKIPTVIKVEKWSITDIRPLIDSSKTISYIDINKLQSCQDLLEFVKTNSECILCIDNVEKLVFSEKIFKTSQLLYSLIKQEEYDDHDIHIDFSKYTAILLADGKDRNANYEFFDYRGGMYMIM